MGGGLPWPFLTLSIRQMSLYHFELALQASQHPVQCSVIEVARMSITISEPLRGRALFDRIWKFTLRRVVLPGVAGLSAVYLFPKIALFYLVCGAYDVSRNRPLTLSTTRRYFLGNGVLLWVLSPINILLDLFSLPYINKGTYKLEDLPLDFQDEVERFIKVTNEADLVQKSEEQVKQHRRAMILWRSYGVKVDPVVNVPSYDAPWKYIKTIGLSVFNTKITTSSHFGWLRQLTPVMLPPGRFRLGTRPLFTGSSPAAKTIGSVVVAALAANAAPLFTTITATGKRNKSATRAGSR
jgi:hypothetical protein